MLTNKEGPGFLLFGGTNDRALLALCRAFEAYHVPYGLIGRSSKDLLKVGRYRSRYLLDRESEHLEVDQIIAAAERGNELYGVRPWVVCPTSEYVNLRMFPWRGKLAAHRITIATCQEGLYSELSEKASFRAYCTRLGVPPPKEFIGVEATSLPLPFVAKPRTNLSRSGRILYPYLIRAEEDRSRFLREADPTEFYLEAFVEGESWYLLYYFSANGTVVVGAQRNLIQQGMGKSIVLAEAANYPEPEVSDRFKDQLTKDGYRGFIMVEIKRDARGSAISIEANPRCWGPFQLTMDAGMGLVEAFLNDHGCSVPTPVNGQGKAIYCWTGGMVQALRSGKGLDKHAGRTKALSTFLKGIWQDVYARQDSWSCFKRDLWH